jgi:hypothetical protein
MGYVIGGHPRVVRELEHLLPDGVPLDLGGAGTDDRVVHRALDVEVTVLVEPTPDPA